MNLPPAHEIIEVFRQIVVPSGVAATAVFVMARWLPARLTPLMAVLALVLGFLVGNGFREAVPFRIDSDKPFAVSDLAVAARDSLVRGEGAAPQPARYWLPWTAAFALIVGLIARLMPPAVAWPLRVGVAVLAAFLLVPVDMRTAIWPLAAFATATLALWALLEASADDEPHGAVPVALAVTFSGASAVMLFAHSARLTDVATLFAVSFGALAAVAALCKIDSGGAVPAAAVALPGLMLVGQQDTFSEVPITAFFCVALAPLMIAPLMLPRVERLKPLTRLIVGPLLVGVPVLVGMALAMWYESLDFG